MGMRRYIAGLMLPVYKKIKSQGRKVKKYNFYDTFQALTKNVFKTDLERRSETSEADSEEF